MKKIVFCVAAALAAATPAVAEETGAEPAAQVDETRLAIAMDIIDISYPEETREAMFSAVGEQMEAQMLQSVKSSMDIDDGALSIMERWQGEVSDETDAVLKRHIPDIMDGWAKSFAAIFSEQELRDILAFVSTDSGKGFMLKSVDVVSHPHFAEANQKFMDETMTIVTGKMPALFEELSEYGESKSAHSE